MSATLLTEQPVVLVVDDEPMMRLLLTHTLQPYYRVLAAADGREALDLAGGLGADVQLVVTDIQMPRLNGIALAAQLRQLDRPPAVLFISGFAQEAVPGPILPKPFSPEALLTTVSQLLGNGHHM